MQDQILAIYKKGHLATPPHGKTPPPVSVDRTARKQGSSNHLWNVRLFNPLPHFLPFPPFRHRCVSRHEGSSSFSSFPFSPPPTVLELFCEYILAGGEGREGGSFAADDDDDAHCENGMGVRGKGGSRLWGGKGFADFVEVLEEIKQVELRCYY